MAWSWSHSNEGVDNAEANLRALPKETLEIIFAEWRAAQSKGGIIEDCNAFDERKYNRALIHAKKLDDGFIAASCACCQMKSATCDNGGHEAWLCPSGCGCHTVPISSKERSRELSGDLAASRIPVGSKCGFWKRN